jgi:hypothetical protein
MNPSNIKVVVDPNNQLSARVGGQNTIKVVSSVTSEVQTNELKDLDDINLPSEILDGSILVYNASSMKWEAQDEIDGGDY